MLPQWARDRHRSLLLIGLFFIVPVSTYVGLSTYFPEVGLAESALLPAMAVTLTTVWPERVLPTTRGPWLVSAAIAAITMAVGLLQGALAPAQLAWITFIHLVAAHVLVMVLVLAFGPGRWVAVRPIELSWYYVGSVVASIVAALLWGFPGLTFGQAPSLLTLWWVVRSVTYTGVGTMTVLMLTYWTRPPMVRISTLPIKYHLNLLLLLVSTPLIQLFVFHNLELPTSWMYLIPALWAGMVFTPRSGAVYALAAALAAIRPANLGDFTTGGLFPSELYVDQVLLMTAYLTMVIVLYRDQLARQVVTIQRQRARAQYQADLMQAIFDSMSDGLIITDGQGSPELQNQGVARILGTKLPKEPWPTLNLTERFHLRTPDGERPMTNAELAELAEAKAGGDTPMIAFRLTDDAGQDRVLTVTALGIEGISERRVLLLFHDVTAEYERFTQLSRFAGTVAHDLKNPLTSVVGWVTETQEALAEDDLDTARFSNDRAERAARRMRQIIDDWLAYVVAKEGILRLSNFPLDPLVQEVVELQTGPESGVTVTTEVSHSVRADRSLVRQVLANTVGNSIKYARPDEPATIHIASSGTEDEVTVTVADQGVGIQPGDEERIFGAFSRSDKDAEAYQGTGLGLALCRNIVERHGGTIRAATNEHGGATLTFTLPAA